MAKTKEERLAQRRQHYKENIVQMRLRARNYANENHAERRAYARKYYKRTREDQVAYSRAWRKAHPKHAVEYNRRYRERNPIKFLMTQYRCMAKAYGYAWALTEEQFASFWNKPCHYTGNPVNGIGLDRVDSNRGYEIDNVVSCSPRVNVAKMDMTRSEFIEMCRDVVNWSSPIIT